MEYYYDNMRTILIVDDSPDNHALISDILKNEYKVKVSNNGEKAIRIAKGEKKPDLILLDIMMPEMDGFEVCKILKEDEVTKNIPIIFLTAMHEETDEALGLELGAVDYITEPISIPILLVRIKNHLKLKTMSDFLRDKNEYLEKEVEERTREVKALQDVTIMALASLAETRDTDTGNHIIRTQIYVKIIAEKLKTHPKFSAILTDYYIDMICKSAPLHDIGKVGVPDYVLLKKGKLNDEEFEIIKNHASLGKEAIENAEKYLGLKVDFLKFAKEIAYSHQEKWDGTGYPLGLSGDDIPLSGRIMAIADVYDALVSERIYKDAMTHEEAVEIISSERGTHFDPIIVDVFLEEREEIKKVSEKLKDKTRN